VISISNSIAFLTFQTGAQVGIAESRASLSSGIPSNSFPIFFLRESTTHGEVVIDYSTPSLEGNGYMRNLDSVAEGLCGGRGRKSL